MISAIVLAAGQATRFGQAKQLVSLDGKRMLEHVLEYLRGSDVDEIVVVLGANANEIERQISFHDTRVVLNSSHHEGMSTTLQAGLRALPQTTEAALVVLADQPFVKSGTVNQLIEAYRQTRPKAVIPTYEGFRGNPVVIDRSLFPEIMTLQGDVGCRGILEKHQGPIVTLPVDDPGVATDIDTVEDLECATPRLLSPVSHETIELVSSLRGRPAAMATLIRASGKTPRKEGTKMFVGDDNEVFGSVTIGGCVDARVIERAGEALSTGRSHLLTLNLGDDEASELGLTCGGTVDVYIEPVTNAVRQQYDSARAELDGGRSVALVTVLSGQGEGSRTLVRANGSTEGPIAQELLAIVSRILRSGAGSQTITLDSADIYIEILRPPRTVAIFGGGAVSIPLVALARTLGMRTVVVDSRPRFANRDRFPEADAIHTGIPSEIAGQLAFGPSMAVVLVTHDYKVEIPVLEKALATDAGYIGLLGSRKRGAAVLQVLRENGVAEEQLARVRVPVGLDLGGETVAEIALSILSEIVAVLHDRSGTSLSLRSPQEPALQRR